MKTDPSEILAKSDPPVSLEEHIADCLKVFENLQKVLPALAKITQKNNFWDLLFSSIYLHDWGKSHPEFQKFLKKEENAWASQRHELYSVPFVERLNFGEEDKQLIKRAVLGHHKDFKDLENRWLSPQELKDRELASANPSPLKHKQDFEDNLEKLKTNYSVLQHLTARWVSFYEKHCLSATKSFHFSKIDLKSTKHPYLEIAKATLVEQRKSNEQWQPTHSAYWQNFFLWGATKICDHMGSAKIETLSRFHTEDFQSVQPYKHKGYTHQQKLSQTQGDCILIAPTGTGKTEAALLWLEKQLSISQGRTWYILPYTASINAMYLRLKKPQQGFASPQKIGLFHSKADLFFSTLFANEGDSNERDSAKETSSGFDQDVLKKLREHDGLYFPMRIVTPFQILKWLYMVKGFEKGITQLAGAKFIFDEIHAYDARTFAQLLIGLEWLRKHLHVQTLVMTATLPSFMIQLLKSALGNPTQIEADLTLQNRLKRHHMAMCEGGIADQVEAIRDFLKQQKRTLVVCNTVDAAQKLFREFPEIENKTLLHSRFIFDHRQHNETQLKQENNLLLVGTQSIEVSLDIDYDVLFTEPAPLDALLQRFGRINRKAPHQIKKTCPVFVCKQGGPYDGLIYDSVLVKKTLNELQTIIDQEKGIICESHLQTHLDAVYPHWTDKQQTEFEECQIYFKYYLNKLLPFQKNKEEEAEFYEQFTGIQVVPICYFEDYKKHIQSFDFTEAEKLLITITNGIYRKLKEEEKIQTEWISFLKTGKKKDKLYQFSVWVASCQYDPELGLLHEQATSIRLQENFM